MNARALPFLLGLCLTASPIALACTEPDRTARVSYDSRWQAFADDAGNRYALAGIVLDDPDRVASVLSALGEVAADIAAATDPDRFDRWPAQIVVTTGESPLWVQHILVRDGLALVDDRLRNPTCFVRLHDAETLARRDRAGLWADPGRQVLDAARPVDMTARLDGFAIVEGKIVAAERVGNQIFLNFGQIWKEDFTAVVRASGERALRRGGLDPLGLSGVRVQVRGWLTERNGPSIEVRNRFQLLVIPD